MRQTQIGRRERKRFFEGTLAALVGVLLTCPSLAAEVITDGSLGEAQLFSGPDFLIPDSMGSRSGANLFHSFLNFSLQNGESATFTGPDDIANVISRVTGGEPSTIDGLLRSQVGHASFYLINPAGVLFGENARIDVPADFHASTANELRFADGTSFAANASSSGTLSAAPPESFGFLFPRAAAIEVSGGEFTVASGATFGLSAGSLSLSDSSFTAPGGEVRFAALGGEMGSLALHGALGAPANGELLIEECAVRSSGDGGGWVRVLGGEVGLRGTTLSADNNGFMGADGGIEIAAVDCAIDNSWMTTDALSAGSGGALRFTVQHAMQVDGGGWIRSSAFSSGNSGDIFVTAESLLLDDQDSPFFTGIVTQSRPGATGNAGAIIIDVERGLQVAGGAQLASITAAGGNAGDVEISAGELLLDGDNGTSLTAIASQAASGSLGDAGSISLDVERGLRILSGALLSVSTYGDGNAGDLDIRAESIILDGGAATSFTGIASSAESGSSGNAGIVRLAVGGELRMDDGAEISSSSWGAGDGGDVVVAAGEMVLENGAGISSDLTPSSSGEAGTVSVTVANSLRVAQGASISSSTWGEGDAGSIAVTADEVVLDGAGVQGFTGIVSGANENSMGDSGSLLINAARSLRIANGAQLSTGTWGSGDAGSIEVRTGDLVVDGDNAERLTGIASQVNPGAGGDGGLLLINASGLLQLINGGQLSNSTFGEGKGGSLFIIADEMQLDGRGSDTPTGIFSQSGQDASGDAGEVHVAVAGLLRIADSAAISATTSSRGDGGTLDITAGEMLLDGSGAQYGTGISSGANPDSSGNAGSVFVHVNGQLHIVNGGRIDSTTWASGNAGEIGVRAASIMLDGGLTSPWITGILGVATESASGMVGNVEVAADQLQMVRGAFITIQGSQMRIPDDAEPVVLGRLAVTAGRLLLEGASAISAESTGLLPASSVEIAIDDYLLVSGESRITTEAAASDGGAVVVGGSGVVELRDGIITTSSRGGRGGDITVSPAILIMENGFIQANTDDGAQGGAIFVDVPYLVTPGSIPPLVGGNERHVFQAGSGENVIQAAAPGGEQGTITITSPRLDLGAGLSLSGARPLHPPRLATSICEQSDSRQSSSLLVQTK